MTDWKKLRSARQAQRNTLPATQSKNTTRALCHPSKTPTTLTLLFDTIDLALIKEWDARPGRKLIAVPFNPDVRNIESHDYYHTRLVTAVTEILTTQEASVPSPRPSKDAASKNKTPTSFLIYNITDDQADLDYQFVVIPSPLLLPLFCLSISRGIEIDLKINK